MNRRFPGLLFSLVAVVSPLGWLSVPAVAQSKVETELAAEDQPEEVLRTEIILDARSPIDGTPMTAAEYAQLQAEEQAAYVPPPELPPKVRSTIGLLRLRKFIKTVLPFIPIK
jgi:hypothetical protein